MSGDAAMQSVVAERQRSQRRVVEGGKVAVRQDDYEARRVELQRFLIQQRNAGSSGSAAHRPASSQPFAPAEPAPYIVKPDGHLVARRRFVRRADLASRQADADEVFAGWSSDGRGAVRKALSRCTAVLPKKFLWVVLVLFVLSLRRIVPLIWGSAVPGASEAMGGGASFYPANVS